MFKKIFRRPSRPDAGPHGNGAGNRLEDSPALWKTVAETLLDGVFIIDERGIIRMVNRSAERLSGYRGDELVGRNVSLLCPPPHDSAHDRYIADYLRTGASKVIGIDRDVEC